PAWTLDVHLVVGDSPVCSARLDITEEEKTLSRRWVLPGCTSRFSLELSAVKTETLEQELEAITQLMEVETDNKWAVLTAVLLMRALHPAKHEAEIMANLEKLQALDFKRVEYYRDLREFSPPVWPQA
ncbi:geranylgeranyl transferase type-2 subunit alpha-like, partial [Elysia marginata]